MTNKKRYIITFNVIISFIKQSSENVLKLIEVEIKAKISNPKEMRELIKKNNGVYKFSLIHEDTYFNMPKGLRDFKETDEALRIRKSIEFKKGFNNFKQENFFITYKGEKIDSTTKTRKELELIISNGESMKELLKKLGFQEILTVKKERDLYEFFYKDYNLEVLIDFIPILKANFIEVECLVQTTKDLDYVRNILFDFLNIFNIQKEQSITKSYLELIVDHLKNK